MIPRNALLTACLAAAAVPGGVTDAASESGQGRTGEWELVWRHSETEGYQNHFRDLEGNDAAFPFAWRRLTDSFGDRLAFFDAEGRLETEVFLGPGENGVASEDGSSYLIWEKAPEGTEDHAFRFYQRGRSEPDWEAVAEGTPALFAPDGSLFVIASQARRRDRYQRALTDAGGDLQIVGAGGEVRGELPIFPIFSRLTGNEHRIALLHNRQLVVVGRDGLLDWERDVAFDNLSFRDGVPQLATGDGIIIVCGTGRDPVVRSEALHPARRGSIVALNDNGTVRWERCQSDDDELWFQISAAVSPDGGTVVTAHAPARFFDVQAWDGETGDLLWSRRVRRQPGFRSLSVSPGGRVIVLALSGNRTNVVAWDREGSVIWDGLVPFRGKSAKLAGTDLLVSERWTVKLEYERAGE